MNFNKSVLIAQFLNKGSALDQTELDRLTPLFQDECIKEGDFFIKAGMPVSKVAFVVTGLLRRYNTNEQGQDVTLELIPEDHFYGDLDGWFRRKPTAAHVQAITNCHLLTIALNELDNLRDNNPKFSAIIHFISEEAMYERIETEELMRTGTILEKYQHFLAHYSKWASRIALRDLASFLQISQHMLTQIEEKAINLYH